MQAMALTKQEKQTCYNVKNFFKTDFERYRQLAEIADLKSVSYNGTSGANNVNHQENKTITASYYKNIVDTVIAVIERMHNERYKKVLKYRHIQQLAVWQIAERMKYSDKTIRNTLNQAYLLFADMLAMVTDIDLRRSDYIETNRINRQ